MRKMSAQIRPAFYIAVLVYSIMHATNAQDGGKPEIRSLNIRTDIAYRFANTMVTSMLANRDRKAREAVFSIQLPKTAFITTFAMTIEGVSYNGTIKEKAKARQEYTEARRQGQSAGHIVQKSRNTNKFDVSVNVAAGQKVTFDLRYQELLQRARGMYQNVIYINPGQIVKDLKVDVYINESKEISKLVVPAIKKNVEETLEASSEVNPIAVVDYLTPHSAHVAYHPTPEQQRDMSENGLSGQFIIKYDVDRNYDAGEILVVDGYFVHFIAPTDLGPVRKNVIFVLDISGSMSGRKIAQVKEAMQVILNDLRPGDLFNILLFDDRFLLWNTESLVQANEENIEAAKRHCSSMEAVGSTNINDALLKAIEFFDDQREQEKPLNPSSIIVFLTDGEPTSGETNPRNIISNVRTANMDKYSIFSLGFGTGVDFPFLRKMSLQNNGIARKIYEDSDAALQLQGFYEEISTPLLTDVRVDYLDTVNETTVTKRLFPNYFNGSELVIAGFCGVGEEPIVSARITGLNNDRRINLAKDVSALNPADTSLRASTERLWAYLTITELLDKMDAATDNEEKAQYEAEALRKSLQYSFVTPLTSMIVKKPNENDSRTDLTDSDVPQRPRYAYCCGASRVRLPPGGSGLSSGPMGQSVAFSPVDLQSKVSYLQPVASRGAYDAAAPATHLPPWVPTPTHASHIPVKRIMLSGIEGPRILVNKSGTPFCFDDGSEGSNTVLRTAGTYVTALFEEEDGEILITEVTVERSGRLVIIRPHQIVMRSSQHATTRSDWSNVTPPGGWFTKDQDKITFHSGAFFGNDPDLKLTILKQFDDEELPVLHYLTLVLEVHQNHGSMDGLLGNFLELEVEASPSGYDRILRLPHEEYAYLTELEYVDPETMQEKECEYFDIAPGSKK